MPRIANLEVDIPASWEDHSLYSFVAPPTDVSPGMTVKQSPFRKNVVLQQRPVGPDATIDDCVEATKENTHRDFGPDIQISEEAGPASSTFPSRRLTYTLVDDVTSTPVAQVIYVALVGEVEWQVAFSAPALELKASVAEFDGIVATIRPA